MERDITDYFREITQSIYLKVEDKLGKYGLVKGQAQLLLIIKDNEGCTQKDLAGYFNVKYSSISERINRLESLGYIARVHEDGNFKNNKIYITNEGKTVATQCRRIMNEIETELYKGITKKEVTSMEKILKKMITNME